MGFDAVEEVEGWNKYRMWQQQMQKIIIQETRLTLPTVNSKHTNLASLCSDFFYYAFLEWITFVS